MAPLVTDYVEIQRDEIAALKSIYMGDFEEDEAKLGAWNKTLDRTFRLRLKDPSRDDGSFFIKLAVSLPATYPKTLPRLALGFGERIPPSIRKEAEKIIREKPKALLGLEMIFEIATALQETLDQFSSYQDSAQNMSDVHDDSLNLYQERINSEAAATLRAQEAENERLQARTENDEGKRHLLSQMITQERARMTGRSDKQITAANSFAVDGMISGGIHFDNPITIKDTTGAVVVVQTVHHKVEFRSGPITKVFTVHAWGGNVECAPFLALKECHIASSRDETIIKKGIQNLESALDRISRLPPHSNILKPLNFSIKKSPPHQVPIQDGWDIHILASLASRGSLMDVLKVVDTLSLETARVWIVQLLEGLAFYHRNGAVHGRVHIGNILVEEAETDRVVVKLADGEYQHILHLITDHKVQDDSFAANPFWIAPELKKDNENQLSAATDIWNLGVVLLQMIFGVKITDYQCSPVDFIGTRDITRSVKDFLGRIFVLDPRSRISAFELKMFEFLRDEETGHKQLLSPRLMSEFPRQSLTMAVEAPTEHNSLSKPFAFSRYMNDFEEIGLLGRGGFGEVVKARHKLENQAYAIKKIKQDSTSSLNTVLSEVVLLSQLNHPNVVRYFTAWIEKDGFQVPGYSRTSSSDFSSSHSSKLSLEANRASGLFQGRSDGLFAKSSGGLDFIAADPPDIIFGYDDEDEDPGGDRMSTALSEQEGKPGRIESIDGEKEHWSEEKDEKPKGNQNEAGRKFSKSGELVTKTILYIQMQYCERQTLRDLIIDDLSSKPLECWRLFRQILQGLAHIHAASIVHRDLKPENIFIDYQADVRIGDFGLARPGDHTSVKADRAKEIFSSFTKSIGTAFYVAPEVRSASTLRYDDKADMYSLGIILFEMSYQMETGMERARNLDHIRQENHSLPVSFEDPEKRLQGDIILSLIRHIPSDRPSSSELLSSRRIPAQPEDETIRAMLRSLRDPKSTTRRDLLKAIFSKEDENILNQEKMDKIRSSTTKQLVLGRGGSQPDSSDGNTLEPDPLRILEEVVFDLARPEQDLDDVHVQNLVKSKIGNVFRQHGAVELPGPLLHTYSSFYSNYSNSAFKMLRPDNKMMQAPYDLTLPHARYLATDPHPILKSFTFGDVWRDLPFTDAPKVLSQADFNLASYSSTDHSVRNAEIIKVVDEVIDAFPSLAAVQLCYHINHSRILDAILEFCRIDKLKSLAVKDEISKLNYHDWTWAKLKHNLRGPLLNIAATSLEELQLFDFRDTLENALQRLRHLLRNTERLENVFVHLESIALNLVHFNVKRKVYLNPLGCFNEKFYRGEFLFQCIYDNKKRDVFAAGGCYDQLVHYFQINPKLPRRFAVSLSMNWQALCGSMVRYHQRLLRNLRLSKANLRDTDMYWANRRCDVRIELVDRKLHESSSMEIAAQLWSNGISAEIGYDYSEEKNLQNAGSSSREAYLWIILIKNDGMLRVRNTTQKEETEMTKSEFHVWLRSITRDRDRLGVRKHDSLKLLRQSSNPDTSIEPSDRGADVRVLMSQNKGKKTNRKAIIEDAQFHVQELVRESIDGPLIAAIETSTEIFDGLRATRLAEPETWKKLFRTAPAHERHYLEQFHQLLQEMARDAASHSRNAFIYNFRSRNCIAYDLGPSS